MLRTSLTPPSARVLDLFAVPGPAQPLSGGSGQSWRAGDLALSPGREEQTQEWLSPMLARLAVRLDERPDRSSRDLRLVMPVPARNGSWVVDGWAASRFEPGTSPCRELPVVTAAGRLLHAELSVHTDCPAAREHRTDRWARAERVSFGGDADLLLPELPRDARRFLLDVRRLLDLDSQRHESGRDQLVHADLANNVLIDAAGAPLVIDFSPAWRSSLWAEAVAVLDCIVWWDADWSVLADWQRGRELQAMLRAVLFRAMSDDPVAVEPYERVLQRLMG